MTWEREIDVNPAAYVYDIDIITENVARVQANFPNTRLFYAMKANPLPHIIHHMTELGLGIEVASAGEMQICIQIGVSAKDIIFAGPAKSEREIQYALSAGIYALHCESTDEFNYAAKFRRVNNATTMLALRINPAVGLRSTIENMTGGPSRFGVDEELIAKWIKSMSNASMLQGIHLYQASQIRNWKEIARSIAQLDSIISDHMLQLSYVNYGGGFGIPLEPDHEVLDVQSLGSWFRQTHNSAQTRTAFELGRYLVGNAGCLLARVIRIKRSRGKQFVMTGAGIHNFLRPVITGEIHQIRNTTMHGEHHVVESVVTGPLCTPIDVIGTCSDHIEVGDVLRINDTGAYGRSLSPLEFLAHATPEEWIRRDGKLHLARKSILPGEYSRIGLQDFKAHQ